jgi:dTDP-4-dehydrorhamnose 3,5-epimerase
MTITRTKFPEVLLINTPIYKDDRGYFIESYQARKFSENGISHIFVQDNISYSIRGTLRGLHFQHPHDQGKLVCVLAGAVFDIVVDVRYGSPTFGEWIGEEISSENNRRLWIPSGFAHGFMVLSDTAIFSYKCTDYYAPHAEHTLLWNDPTVVVSWPTNIRPLLSPKDAAGCPLLNFSPETLPQFQK